MPVPTTISSNPSTSTSCWRGFGRCCAATARRAQRRHLGEWLFTPGSWSLYSPTGLRVALTETETALIGLLAESPDHVFSRDEILNAVFTAADAPGSVDTYVHYIRRKSTPELIETVRGHGYRIGAPT